MGSTKVDDDLDVGLTNTTSNSKYPVEFKINVGKLPTEGAQLLIRAHDVDEYNPKSTAGSTGEWDRVIFLQILKTLS